MLKVTMFNNVLSTLLNIKQSGEIIEQCMTVWIQKNIQLLLSSHLQLFLKELNKI